MKIIILILTLLIYSSLLNAQPLSRKILNNSIPTSKRSIVYILNGEAYNNQRDSIKLDSVLKHYTVNDITEMSVLKTDKGDVVDNPNYQVIIINLANPQSLREIKAKLRKIKRIFVDKYYGFSQHTNPESKDPALYIDDKEIKPSVAKVKIKELQLDKILHIEIKKRPQDTQVYGQNAKNGLVKIWMKK